METICAERRGDWRRSRDSAVSRPRWARLPIRDQGSEIEHLGEDAAALGKIADPRLSKLASISGHHGSASVATPAHLALRSKAR
jgi:hypothetical protein